MDWLAQSSGGRAAGRDLNVFAKTGPGRTYLADGLELAPISGFAGKVRQVIRNLAVDFNGFL